MGNDQGNVPLIHLQRFSLAIFTLCAVTLAAHDGQHLRCGLFDSDLSERLASLADGRVASRPLLPLTYPSPSGRFLIHYTVEGPDAVPTVDRDGSGIPDYVEDCGQYLDHAWRAEIDTMGYSIPPTDGDEGGSSAIDCYLRDLSKAGSTGSGQYGVTRPSKRLTQVQPERYTTWMEIDNDFSPDDRNVAGQPVFATFGIEALRVTTAHELHHVIQLGSYGLTTLQQMVYEFTATWMEIRVHPDVRDWAAYTSQLLQSPERWAFSDPQPSNGYMWAWYGAALYRRSGDAILRRTWERIRENERPFEALVNACLDNSTPLHTMFCDDLPELYRTGSRGADNTLMAGADSLPEIRLTVDEAAAPPALSASGDLRSFETRAFRFSVPSIVSPTEPISLGVVLTWPSIADMTNATGARRTFTVTLFDTQNDGANPIDGSLWSIRVEPDDICYQLVGVNTTRISGPYPHPVVLDEQERLHVPVRQAVPGDVATITVFTPSMIAVETSTVTVSLDGPRIVATWPIPATLSAGIHLLQVDCAGTTTLHKIVVRRTR